MLKKNLFQVRKRCTNDGRQNRRHSCKSGSQSWFYKISEFQSYICISTKSVEAVLLIEPTVGQLLVCWAVANFFVHCSCTKTKFKCLYMKMLGMNIASYLHYDATSGV